MRLLKKSCDEEEIRAVEAAERLNQAICSFNSHWFRGFLFYINVLPYERDRILEGVVKNELAVLVSRKELKEITTEAGAGYCLAGNGRRQKETHAA